MFLYGLVDLFSDEVICSHDCSRHMDYLWLIVVIVLLLIAVCIVVVTVLLYKSRYDNKILRTILQFALI